MCKTKENVSAGGNALQQVENTLLLTSHKKMPFEVFSGSHTRPRSADVSVCHAYPTQKK